MSQQRIRELQAELRTLKRAERKKKAKSLGHAAKKQGAAYFEVLACANELETLLAAAPVEPRAFTPAQIHQIARLWLNCRHNSPESDEICTRCLEEVNALLAQSAPQNIYCEVCSKAEPNSGDRRVWHKPPACQPAPPSGACSHRKQIDRATDKWVQCELEVGHTGEHYSADTTSLPVIWGEPPTPARDRPDAPPPAYFSAFKCPECGLELGVNMHRHRIICSAAPVSRSSWVCEERPSDVIRVAQQMYEWIYGS